MFHGLQDGDGEMKSDASNDSRLSLDSRSPDFMDTGSKQEEVTPADKGHRVSTDSSGESESELEKAISSAAAAVESFASEIGLEVDDLNRELFYLLSCLLVYFYHSLIIY